MGGSRASLELIRMLSACTAVSFAYLVELCEELVEFGLGGVGGGDAASLRGAGQVVAQLEEGAAHLRLGDEPVIIGVPRAEEVVHPPRVAL